MKSNSEWRVVLSKIMEEMLAEIESDHRFPSKGSQKGRRSAASVDDPPPRRLRQVKKHKLKPVSKKKSVKAALSGKQAISRNETWAKTGPTPSPPERPISQIAADAEALQEADAMLAAHPQVPASLPGPTDLQEISSRFGRLGTAFAPSERDSRPPVDIVIGLDVGSTSTKTVLRLISDEAVGLPVPVPDWLRADGHPYYWRTLLWRTEQGQLDLLPSEGADVIDRLKVDLLRARADASGDAARVCMTAWIVLMARQAVGWLAGARPRLALERRFRIEVNLGVPADSTEASNGLVQTNYARCARAAGAMLASGSAVTDSNVRRFLMNSNEAPSRPEACIVSTQAELAGALQGFLNSYQKRNGHYLLMDVGGLTVDCVLFRHYERAEKPLQIYASLVRPFGAEVVAAWVGVDGTRERAAAVIGSRVLADTIKAGARKITVPPDQLGVLRTFETIMIGGGRHSLPHQEAVPWCEKSMRQYIVPPALPVRPLVPDADDMDAPLAAGRNTGRLLVAMGLSFDRDDLPAILPSDAVRDAIAAPRSRFEDHFVGPEMT